MVTQQIFEINVNSHKIDECINIFHIRIHEVLTLALLIIIPVLVFHFLMLALVRANHLQFDVNNQHLFFFKMNRDFILFFMFVFFIFLLQHLDIRNNILYKLTHNALFSHLLISIYSLNKLFGSVALP